jgi:hypothetical protein
MLRPRSTGLVTNPDPGAIIVAPARSDPIAIIAAMPVTAAAANNDTPVDDGAPVDPSMESPVDAAAVETTSSAAMESTSAAAATPRHGICRKSKSRRQSGDANNFAHHGDILPFKTEENDRMKCP